ncbi:MAG TPA: response regulator [Asticcacaulis sp.]|nr:response regulator [Asticcacaulis sp.]
MSKGSVLVLEDSRVQAQLISKMLNQLGWSALLSFDHRTVLNLLRSSSVDLMLLDVYIDGDNTLAHMAEFRCVAPETPVAIMTAGGAGGQALQATLAMARRVQADFLLPKPFAPENLAPILDEVAHMRCAPELPKHVLVVDDCSVVRKLTTKALAEKGYRISEARSMEEAFERVDIAHVDVVLSDVFMPGMGGIEGISIIKSTWPKVAVVAMSAGAERRLDTAQALAAAKYMGADALLSKPFTPDDMNFLIEAMLEDKAAA